jgi:hypothetical protein
MNKHVVLAVISSILCFLLQVGNAEAKTTSTVAAGNWGDAVNWSNGLPVDGDIINIDHVMNFNNVNINIKANTTYNFNAGASGSAIPLALSMENSTSVLNIYSNVSFAGGINLNAGVINVYNGATLTVTNQINQAGTQINVHDGANFNVTGNYTNNGGNIHVDGLVTITGTYNGQNQAAVVSGNGNIYSSGHMIGMNQSLIFNTYNPYCPSNCDGRSLFGGGNCNSSNSGRTATASTANTTTCVGDIAALTSTLTGSTNWGFVYQWQYKNSANVFVNVPGATSSTYSPAITNTTVFRVVIGAKQNENDPYCYTYSSSLTINIGNSCPRAWLGATNTDWNTASNWVPAHVPTDADDVIILNVSNKPLISPGATVNVKSITVNNGSSLTLSSGTTLNVYGNITNNGTFTTTTGSTVAFKGSSAQTVNGVSDLYNVVINNTGGGVSLSSAVTLKGTLSLTKGVLSTNSNLTINFDNGGNIGYNSADQGSINGTVSAHRDVTMRTHYIAVPFSGATAAQVQATTPLYQNTYWRMYTKDFASQNWTAVTNTTTSMPLGTGFSLTLATPAPVIFTGAYDHQFEFTGPSYSNINAEKYFLVGNPYPSTLDWENASGWEKTNVGGAIYFWDPANSRVASYVSSTNTNGATQYISPMQAFMVTTTGTGGSSSVSIKSLARVSNSLSPYFRTAQDDVVRIKLVSGGDSTRNDETVIRFNEQATNDFDYDLDARKILNSGGVPSVYTTAGKDSYSINSFASVDSAHYIPLAAKLASDGAYKLKISGTNPNLDYILVDKLLGTKQSIEADKDYAFNGLKTDNVNRFELQLRLSEVTIATGIQSANKSDGLGIYSSTKGFVIKTDRYAGNEAEIEIMDVTGNSIKTLFDKNLSLGSTYIPLDIAEGTYLVKVHVEGNTFAGMVVLIK